MGLFEQFPYTNFHELNLTWFLDTFRDLLNAWEEQQREFADLKEAWEELKQFVNDYFDNLDVQNEINNKLDQMARDGSLQAVLQQFVPDVVTQWLNDNITPTSPPVDASLSIAGAAADAKVTGEKIKDTQLGYVNIYDVVQDEYVATDGSFASYAGWSRSDYIDIRYLETFVIDMPRSGRNLGFYDINYAVVEMHLNLPAGVSSFTRPAAATYFVISEEDSYVHEIKYINPEREYLTEMYQNDVSQKTLDMWEGWLRLGTLVSGEYVDTDGSFAAYAGWSRSGYLDIHGADELTVWMPRNGRNIGFYDQSYNVVEMHLNMPQGEYTLTVPSNTWYFVVSEDDVYVDQIKYKDPEKAYLNRMSDGDVLNKANDYYELSMRVGNMRVPGEYVLSDGTFAPYSGWTRSDYLDCRNCSMIYIYMPNAGRYISFYDSAYTYEYHQLSDAGWNECPVPVGSAYFVVYEADTVFDDIRYNNPIFIHAWEAKNGRAAKSRKVPAEIRSISRLGYDANGTYPEQTIAAYQEAIRQGYKILLCDLSFTEDDVAICLHDTTINRTARNLDGTTIGTTISITNHTYDDIKGYDYGIYKGAQFAGQKLLTLDDFLYFAKGVGAEVYIEMKYCPKREHAAIAVDIVRKHGMERHVSWCSFFQSTYGQKWYLSRIIENDPFARVGLMTVQGVGVTDDYMEALLAVQTDVNEIFAFNWSDEIVTSDQAAFYTDHNISYEVGTLATEQDIIDFYERSDVMNIISGIETSKFVASEVIKTHMLT